MARNVFEKAFRIFRNLIFVPKCAACGERLFVYDGVESHSKYYDVLCAKCHRAWVRAKRKECKGCGRPTYKCLCAPIALGTHSLPKLVMYKPHADNVPNKIIYSMKHVNDMRIFGFAAEELAVTLREYLGQIYLDEKDCFFTWIPRGKRAKSEDGFDQSERLARLIASDFAGEKNVGCIFERHGSTEQKTLGREERRENAEKSLSLMANASETVAGRVVVIIDDVVTTGASMKRAIDIVSSMNGERAIPLCVGLAEHR